MMNDKEFKNQLYDIFKKRGLESEIKSKVAEKMVQDFRLLPKDATQKGKMGLKRIKTQGSQKPDTLQLDNRISGNKKVRNC